MSENETNAIFFALLSLRSPHYLYLREGFNVTIADYRVCDRLMIELSSGNPYFSVGAIHELPLQRVLLRKSYKYLVNSP
ncbi:MAG: hypothetical protein KME52_07380 [Desmonostoc geniculatum HA4340-LM1]|jgi:hypothetical protein|nr:hypothetical protein [Desmonostoc geniculatum HA4340-LM1]